MGATLSKRKAVPFKDKLTITPSRAEDTAPGSKKLRVLCLHGWRTSGDIMSYQTAAMQHHTDLDYTFVTAPHAATGPPDSGIASFYSDFEYFEWFLKDGGDSGLSHSMDLLIEYLRNASPPFDGIMGFSQGAGMVTRLAHRRSFEPSMHPLFRFVILIGGVPPMELEALTMNITLPSLHITGSADPFLPLSYALERMYREEHRHALRHQEGHNLPSIRSGLYPQINLWLQQLQK